MIIMENVCRVFFAILERNKTEWASSQSLKNIQFSDDWFLPKYDIGINDNHKTTLTLSAGICAVKN